MNNIFKYYLNIVMLPGESWVNFGKRTQTKIIPPLVPFKEKALLSRDELRLKKELLRLIPAFQEAPIILASTHGSYDLSEEPESWLVPENTYIFETQSIGDKTLTTIDDPIWKLCQSKFRPFFINYFLGNKTFFDDQHEKPDFLFIEVFKNLIFYKPGDKIYSRDLTIGGGRKQEPSGIAREDYVNMGFYKFNMKPISPSENAPTRKKTRRANSEILKAMRTSMVEDPDFIITNKDIIELINFGNKIDYEGIKIGRNVLKPFAEFSYPRERDNFRIYIFSSCASPNCSYLKDNTGNEIKNPYTSPLCNRRLEIIESHQAAQINELRAMGIESSIGSFDYLSDDDLLNVKNKVELTNHSLRKVYKNRAPEVFVENDSKEIYAKLNEDVKNWWKIVLPTKPPTAFASIESREASGGTRRKKKKK